MADENQRVAFLGKLDGLDVHLGDEWAGSVDDAQLAFFAGFADLRRNPVGAVDYALPFRNFINAINEDGAFLLEFFDHEPVVDDFLADIDWRPERLECDADDVDGTDHPGAKSTGLQEQ